MPKLLPKLWLPSRLYEALPFVQFIFGLSMLFAFGANVWGAVAGSMLCVAAVLIWAMRFHTRRKIFRKR